MFRHPVMYPSRSAKSYLKKVLSVEKANLVGLWLQSEPSGGVALDKSGHGHDGAYTGVTLAQAGVPGMGYTSPLFDGSLDYNDIHSAGLANDNLLSNPGFETADAGAPIWEDWDDTVGNGALANETGGNEYEGSDSAKVTSGAASDTKTAQTITTVAGKRYRLRFYSEDDGTNPGRYGIYDVSGSADIVAITATAIAATYAPTVVEFIAPATSTRIDLWCPAVNTKIAYFDACEVRSMDGFLGDEGTLLAWAKVSAAGVWSDGTDRYIANLRVDASNYYAIYKNDPSKIQFFGRIGATSENISKDPAASVDWMCLAMTWSKSGNAVSAYYNGAVEGTPQTIANTWLGDIASDRAVIGGADSSPAAAVWSGPIGPVALWNKALTADQIAYLSTV